MLGIPPEIWTWLAPVLGALVVVILERFGIKVPGIPRAQQVQQGPLGQAASKVQQFQALKDELKKLRSEIDSLNL